MNQFYTAESVTEGHPDKLCDLIADSVLDACLAHDPLSRVACEVMVSGRELIIAGEITSLWEPGIPRIAREVLAQVGYDPDRFDIQPLIRRQSPDIAAGVGHSLEERRGVSEDLPTLQLGAGDQGVMVGYACRETPELLPLPVVLANRLAASLTMARKTGAVRGLLPDVPYDELCFEITSQVLAPALDLLPPDEDTKILINPAGRFVTGGPDADTGLTGRKLAVDAYGVFAPLGGGAFSGKDPTKVDRSGAYAARYIAKNMVAAGLCERCQVTLAYAIGKAEPVMVDVDTFGTGTVCTDDCLAQAARLLFPLTPAGMIGELDLLTPRYAHTAVYGHFGKAGFPWERTDRVKLLRLAVM